jgi:hypothetical protein
MEASPRIEMVESTKKHRELVEDSIQVYQLLGHAVEEVTGFDEARTDLRIRSSQDELWFARCDTSESLNAESIMSFIVSCSLQGPQQLAVITSGQIGEDALEYVAGHPIYLVDEQTLQEYIVRAERLHIEHALTAVSIPDEVGSTPAEPPKEIGLDAEARQCPFCDGENLAGTIICDYCDRNLVVTAPLSMDGKELSEIPEPMFSST